MKRLVPYLLFILLSAPLLSARSTESLKAETLLLQGLEQYMKGDLRMAGELLQSAQALDPSNDAVHYYLGYIKASENKASDALFHFGRAYSLDTANVWYAMRLAHLSTLMGRVSQADSLLSSLRKRRPYDPNILSSLVEVYMMESRYDEADSLLSRIERVEGQTDYVDVTRMEMARQRGDFIALFDGMNAYFSRVVVPASMKKDMFERLMRGGDPRFNYVHLSDYERLINTCLEVHPSDTAITHLAGSFYYASNRKDKLMDICSRNRDDIYMVALAAYSLFGSRDYEAAIPFCDRLIALAPDDRRNVEGAMSMRADCYFSLERYDEALREYGRLVRMNPANIMALNNYAYYLSVLGKNLGKAARMSRKTIEAEPENATYLDTYAWILYKQKKYAKAQEIFRKAMIYGGRDNAEVLKHYAATLEALGQTALAEAYRQKAAIKEHEGRK